VFLKPFMAALTLIMIAKQKFSSPGYQAFELVSPCSTFVCRTQSPAGQPHFVGTSGCA
jgi:hypothetical protein